MYPWCGIFYIFIWLWPFFSSWDKLGGRNFPFNTLSFRSKAYTFIYVSNILSEYHFNERIYLNILTIFYSHHHHHHQQQDDQWSRINDSQIKFINKLTGLEATQWCSFADDEDDDDNHDDFLSQYLTQMSQDDDKNHDDFLSQCLTHLCQKFWSRQEQPHHSWFEKKITFLVKLQKFENIVYNMICYYSNTIYFQKHPRHAICLSFPDPNLISSKLKQKFVLQADFVMPEKGFEIYLIGLRLNVSNKYFIQ